MTVERLMQTAEVPFGKGRPVPPNIRAHIMDQLGHRIGKALNDALADGNHYTIRLTHGEDDLSRDFGYDNLTRFWVQAEIMQVEQLQVVHRVFDPSTMTAKALTRSALDEVAYRAKRKLRKLAFWKKG